MNIDQATFLRIDTSEEKPYLEGARGEVVVSTLVSGHDKGLYDLLGFCVLPNELQLMFIPKGKTVTDIMHYLEDELQPQIDGAQPIFDVEIYREKIDSTEEIRQRLRWMHGAPVRARLASVSNLYQYSSANMRYQDRLKSLQGLL